jgi:hypothetical protein
MHINEFEKYCELCLDDLFLSSKTKNEEQFLTCFFPFYNQYGHNILSYMVDFEFAEVLDLIRTLHFDEESKEIDKKTKTRIRLFIYCHIIEVDLVYMILFNMIRTVIGENCSPQRNTLMTK